MVKFYRGLYSNYKYDKTTKTGKHLDCIYFATDVGKILMNGIEFSSSTVDTSKFDAAIKGVTISNNVLTFIPVEGSPFTVTIPTATSTTNGVMSSADKSKLDGIESGALKNTITGVKGGSESTYRTGNINITKTNIGLGNVDNTSDANKPISTALLAALDKKVDKVSGKGLSTNDYTTEDKNKLSGIAAGATANKGTITGIKMNGVSKGTSGIVDLGTVITSHQDISGKLNVSLKGTANGLAELDSNGKVPSSQLPSYVDDVLEYSSKSVFPTTGESGKIYIDTTTNLSYRWGGTTYVEISPSLALGETSSTAYRGDRGKTAYDHSQSAHARTDATKVEKSSTNGNIKINGTETIVYTHPSGTNPHGTTKSDVGLGNVGNFKAVSTVASQGLTDTEKANARANIGAGTSSFSGSYNDLSNKPNIPTVGNGTITITLNGVTKGTFTTNQSGNTTIALTDTDTNTTYGVATSSSLGLVKSGTDITVDSSGNVSVNDDSHNHVISNVDGLQSALDGKAASSHGNHVPTTQAANNAVFLRNDNTWQTVTPANIGAAASGHTHNYAGSSSSGGDATRAIAVADYGNTANTIQIGFSGAGATTSNLGYIAGYLSGGTQIKDVSKDTLKAWLGLGSAAYTNSSTYAAASHTHTASSVTGLATVATSGNYNDLSNKPTQLPANGGTSANSNWLNVNSTLSYGASGLNYFNQSTSTTSGATVNANPTNDWYHILRMNHANGQGYFVDLAFCFHSDIAAFRRIAAGTEVGWKTFIHSGNIGSQSVASATKATQDSAGQQINTTYIKGLSVSGKTITYTKGDGTTGTITTQDTNTTYSAGAGISLNGTTFSNSGVRSVTAGSSANLISINTNGTTSTITINDVANAASANKVITRGNHAETASGTTANAPTTGMLESSGMYMTETYGDSATPASYGNIINLAGSGTGLLLCEWSGADNTLGRLYYRSHRDTSTGGWSGWGTVAFTTDTVAAATNDSAGLLINNTYIKGLSVSGRTITYTKGNGSTGTITTLDTTYSANNGVGLSGTTFYNSGVRSIATGSSNGTISVNTNGTNAEVAVKGLGSAAYTASSAYAAASHNHSSVLDSGNSIATTFAYSKPGLDTTSWFAAWNNYELRAISPAKVLSTIGAAASSHTHTGAQVTMSGYSTLSGGYVTTSDTVNSAVHKIEDLLLWYELN